MVQTSDKSNSINYEIPEFIELIESLQEQEPYELALSYNTNVVECFLVEINNLYKDYNRHFYSDISMYCYTESEENLDYLIKNLKILYDKIRSNEYINIKFNNIEFNDLKTNLRRLIDHVKLETYRNSEIDNKVSQITTELLQDRTDEIMENIKDEAKLKIENSIKDVDRKIDNIGVESVAVIGIFSAVIMTFFGGLSFFGSALENMNDTDPKLTLRVITLIGIVMFNVFYILFLFIGKVIDRPLITRCEHFSENKCEECKTCNNAKSLWYDHRIFVIVNIILIVIFFMISTRIPILKASYFKL